MTDFEQARHNPETAPLVIILAGGPGGATADHIFGHDGPCKFRNGKTTLNPYSFNEYANLLYIDQPIAAGFSHGRNPIDSTDSATKYVYRFLQAFLAGFKQFQGRDTGIFTASYGGHTGPSLGYEILLANNLIRAGDFDGIHVNLTSVCLQNAMMDAGIQMRADVEYAFTNNHRQMINQTMYHHLLDTFDSDIEPVIERCHAGVDDQACVNATELYGPKIESAISESLEEIDPLSDVYDIRKSQDYPSLTAKYLKPDALIKYLSQPEVIKAIGAQHAPKSEDEDDGGRDEIMSTGDRKSSLSCSYAQHIRAHVHDRCSYSRRRNV